MLMYRLLATCCFMIWLEVGPNRHEAAQDGTAIIKTYRVATCPSSGGNPNTMFTASVPTIVKYSAIRTCSAFSTLVRRLRAIPNTNSKLSNFVLVSKTKIQAREFNSTLSLSI